VPPTGERAGASAHRTIALAGSQTSYGDCFHRGSSPQKSSCAVVLRCSGGTVSATARRIERAHPSSGETDALLVLCAAERELAGELLTPDAGRQEASARARGLDELRRQFRFAGLTKQIGMALAVIPQVRFGVHGSLLPSSKT